MGARYILVNEEVVITHPRGTLIKIKGAILELRTVEGEGSTAISTRPSKGGRQRWICTLAICADVVLEEVLRNGGVLYE